MPEQGKAEQPTVDARAESLDCDLGHHHRQPDQSGGDVQAVTTDNGEERGKESAALRCCTAGDHVRELMDFDIEERGTEHESDQSKHVCIGSSLRTDRQRHHPARVAGDKKTSRLDCNADLIEQLVTGRTARGRMHEYRVSRKQRREHHDVAQQENPEAESDHDSFWGRSSLAGKSKYVLFHIVNGDSDIHSATSVGWTRSNPAIVSA